MESKAILRYARVTPRKARRVASLIKGSKAGDAIIKLSFLPHAPARIIKKVLKSAMANAEQKKVADPEAMRIAKVLIDDGPAMKRVLPRAMGRANIIKKRTSHISIFLEE